MAKGLVFVSIAYPGKLNCPEGTGMFFEFEGKSYGLALSELLTSVHLQDFSNELIRDSSSETISLKYPVNQIDRFQKSFSTDHHGIHQVMDNKKNEDLIYKDRVFSQENLSSFTVIMEYEDENDLKSAPDEATKILDEFLLIYRDVTREGRVRLLKDINDKDIIFKQGTREYNEDEKLKSFRDNLDITYEPINLSETVLTTKTFSTSDELIEEDKDKVFEKIYNRIKKNEFVDEVYKLLGNANEELSLRNNKKYALLESFIAVEMFLGRELLRYKRDVLKIAKGKLDDHDKDLTISYILDVDIFTALSRDSFTSSDMELLGKIKNISTKRNKVVHTGREVTFNEAREAISTCREFIDIVGAKFEDVFKAHAPD